MTNAVKSAEVSSADFLIFPRYGAKDMVRLEDVVYQPRSFGGVSLTLTSGEVVLLCGPSGSGKTTLCGLLAGDFIPSSGNLVWGSPTGADSQPCATVTSDVESQLLGASVAQELQMGRDAAPRSLGDELSSCLDRLAARWRGREDEDPHDLSLGEQQMLLITTFAFGSARAFIIDEGLSGLDEASFVDICSVLRALAQEAGCLVLVVSHEMRVLPWVDRVLGMTQGRLVLDSPAATVTPEQLSRMRIWQGTLEAVAGALNSGVRQAERGGEAGDESAAPLLRYQDTVVDLKRGQVLGVAGVTGSGKSRVLATLAGYDGLPGWTSEASDYRVLLPQRPASVLWHRTVRAELEASLTEGRRQDRTKMRALHDLDDIPQEWLDRSPRTLSQGQMKLVACYCLVLQQPGLLLLDEPFSGLDSDLRETLGRMLREYLTDGGRLVFTSHRADEMVLYSDQLLVLDHGVPVFQGVALEYYLRSAESGLGLPAHLQVGRQAS